MEFGKRIPVILQSDFYKQAHAEQYPEGVTKLVSYATARMSRMESNELVVFGIQAFVMKWLIEEFNETFFDIPYEEVETYYKYVIGNTFPLDSVDVEKFRKLHKLGYLPIEVGCLPEGVSVPIRDGRTLPKGQCQVPFMYVTNTHPDFAWLTEFLESITSAEVWFPMCVANQAKGYRAIVDHWYNYTGCDMNTCKSAIAEFGFRGGKGQEAAVLASSAFLTSFNKTATIPAIIYNSHYYNEPIDNGNVGGGMISTEHSVMCSNYALDAKNYPVVESPFSQYKAGDLVRVDDPLYNNEIFEVVKQVTDEEASDIILGFCRIDMEKTLEGIAERADKGDLVLGDEETNLLIKRVDNVEAIFLKKLFTKIYPNGALSVVMDSYDYWANILRCGSGDLKEAIMGRNGTVFFRGDSGDPVDIICGEDFTSCESFKNHKDISTIKTRNVYAEDEMCWYRYSKKSNEWIRYEHEPVEVKGTVKVLWEMFGGTVNEAGFKVLDSHVKAIYGDSITPLRANAIYRKLAQKGFAACNVALGAGSFSMNCAETEDHRLLPFTRDSYGIAVKACYAENDKGDKYPIFKNPKTDTESFKKSQRGMIHVSRDAEGNIVAYDGYTSDTIPDNNMLQPIFRDGKMLHVTSLNEIRNTIHNGSF